MNALARASRRAWRSSTLAAVVLCLLSAAGAQQVLANMRPELLDDAVARFESAWERADLDGIEALFDPRVRDVEGRELRSIASGHAWDASLPELGEESVYISEQGTSFEYVLGEGSLSAQWVLVNNVWVLSQLELPYPPLAPTLEEFVDGWTLSSPEELASFFSEAKRPEMQASIESAKTKRGWLAFPEIQSVEAFEVDPRETTAVLLVDGGEVTTKWHFREDGTWGLHGLRLPTRRIRKQD